MQRPSTAYRWWRIPLSISVLAIFLQACAPVAAAPARPPSADQVAALEERLRVDSTNVGALVALGQAYQLLSRPADVVPLLERARSLRPADAGIALRLGIAYEDAARLADAAELYQHYIDFGQDARLRRHLESRLKVLHRLLLVQAARDAAAAETDFAATSPEAGTVAVFPFLIQTQDTSLAPLGRALAELLVTDLSQTDRLRVLERMRVQLLITEMRLAEQGLVDVATAARSGRLLSAGQVVQGSVRGTGEALDLGAAIVNVETGTPEVQSAQTSTSIERLFDAEKALALEIYRVLGVELTAAERERVDRRPTENLRALLAFGLGLESEDVAAFGLASEYYELAASLDPQFDLARERAAEAARTAAAAAVSTAGLWQLADRQSADALAEAEALVPGMEGRDAVAELFGQEGLTGRGSVIRILLRGGGGG